MSIKRRDMDPETMQAMGAVSGDADLNLHFGIIGVFAIDDDSDDVIAMAKLEGKIRVGDSVNIVNLGDDDPSVKTTVITGIETGPDRAVNEAADCMVGLILEHGGSIGVRKGTVGYAENCSSDNIRAAYIAALGQTFVANDAMDIAASDRAQLTIADYDEIMRLYRWYLSQHPEKKIAPEVVDEICRNHVKTIAGKILAAESIYVLVNKDTGEAHMLSKTFKQDDGRYMCTPPDIMVFTKAQMDAVKKAFPEEKFEYKLVENGEEKKGIYNFLGDAFYLNGACGVVSVSGAVRVDKSLLVTEPDYTDVPEASIPVTNPGVERWLLLMAQVGKADTKDKELIANLYYQFFCREVSRAKFLIPMKHSGDIPKPDAEGRTVLEKDTTISLAVRDGKFGRPAVNMFTDWKRFRMQYGEKWDAVVQTIDGMIDNMDCAINATKYYKAGCYINTEMYQSIVRANNKAK